MSSTAEVTIDAFLGGRLWLAQAGQGHRAGLDAVMLAAAARVEAGDRVLDAGAGMGVVGLCIASRVRDCTVTGIEIDPGLSKLAAANAARNGLDRRHSAISADLTAPLPDLAPLGVLPESFEVVVANPPFYRHGQATPSLASGRARAAIMPEGGLEGWVRFMAAMAAPGGALVLVQPAAELPELLSALDGCCGGIVVFPLFPRSGGPAHRIIVSGRKGSRAPLVIRQGLVVHGGGNAFTPEAEAVLRVGAAIDLYV